MQNPITANRVRLGYTEQQVADHLNIPATTYRHYESGEYGTPYPVACAIAELLDADLDQLFTPTKLKPRTTGPRIRSGKPVEPIQTFGTKLRRLREARKLNQTELGAALGVSRQAVSLWEINRREPSLAMLAKICRIFQVSADHFIFDNN